jgi:hypothetical protein
MTSLLTSAYNSVHRFDYDYGGNIYVGDKHNRAHKDQLSLLLRKSASSRKPRPEIGSVGSNVNKQIIN